MRTPLLGLAAVAYSLLGVQLVAAQTFLGKTPAAWLKQLDTTKEISQRRSAAFALGKLGGQAVTALPRLKKIAGDIQEHASVREAAAFALGEIGRESLVLRDDKELVQTLSAIVANDTDSLVRRSAAYALGCLGSDAASARPVLEAALADSNPPMVRQNAAWALGRIGDGTVPALRKALLDTDNLVRRDAAYSLGVLGPTAAKPALPELVACCQTSDSEVRRAALTVLIRLVGPEDGKASPALRQALKDPDMEVRRNAALALSNIGGPEAVAALPFLREGLRPSEAVELRRQAAVGIRNLGAAAKAAVPDLIRALTTDPDEEVRSSAAFGLGGIGEAAEQAVPVLAKTVANPKEQADVRVKCAVALARIGAVPAAETILPTLLKVLQDPTQDNRVRQRLMWALRVHHANLRTLPGVYPALTKVLSEPRMPDTNMLRYDCAYMLGMLQGSNVPEKALDVLLEFLQDNTILIFASEESKVQGAGQETGVGKANVKEVGKGDGRVMAVQALTQIGAARVRQRSEIVKQLQVLAKDNEVFADLRQKAQDLLRDLKK